MSDSVAKKAPPRLPRLCTHTHVRRAPNTCVRYFVFALVFFFFQFFFLFALNFHSHISYMVYIIICASSNLLLGTRFLSKHICPSRRVANPIKWKILKRDMYNTVYVHKSSEQNRRLKEKNKKWRSGTHVAHYQHSTITWVPTVEPMMGILLCTLEIPIRIHKYVTIDEIAHTSLSIHTRCRRLVFEISSLFRVDLVRWLCATHEQTKDEEE